jgi:2-polyprenyl-3-methyl-5-hydroxy-6-metoxy-1,4-benzoquinol methylase
MANSSRIDKTLFDEKHYLGKPADEEDKIISRRLAILNLCPQFFGKDLTCIEVGCGSGVSITRISNQFSSTLGIDIYDYSNDFELQKLKNSAPNSEFRKIDLEKETIPEQFDRLISFEVIEHLRSEDSVAAFNRTLKEGGMAAISVPNKWWIFETHGAKLPILPWNRVPFFSWLPTSIHEKYANARIYTMGRIQNILKKNGFTILETCYITAPMDVLKDGAVKRFLTRYIFKNNVTSNPFLSTSIFVLAQKNKAVNG